MSKKKLARKLFVILVFSLFTFHFSLFTASAAHRFHTSLARMDYNAQAKTIEVSIRLFTHDLVPVLERKYGRRVDLEKRAEADRLIADYLRENFVLVNKNGDAREFKWIGREADVDLIYVYVEIPYAESFEGAELQNTIFFESFAEQTNLVVCRFEEKKPDLLFKVGDSRKEIKMRIAGAD